MKDQEILPVEDLREVLKPCGGRDELNLAEFPITLLSDRVPKGCKTLVFEIEPRDPKSSQVVSRKVTITGSDAYGLPTALDDEVLVALVQLTKLKNDFTEPTVSFSRYELVKLLGWPDDGRSYRRVEESIRRWVGVTLYYDNAWWNKETNTWVTEGFHVIERCSLIDQKTKRARKLEGQPELALSFFKWNEVIFRSFQAGSLKRLDIDAYFSYSTSVAKRMYRFLDKRFWVKNHWEFDLKEFAFEHIGLSRKYDVAQIKLKLQPGIDELTKSTKERAAFIELMTPEERYTKVGKGRWLITFTRKVEASPPRNAPVPEMHWLVTELIARDVAPEIAEELVRTRPADLITLRIEVFDWIRQQKNQRLIKESPTGYLISSIRDRYLSVPKGFESRSDRERRQATEEEARRKEQENARRKAHEKQRSRELQRRIKELLAAMTPEDLAHVEAEALAHADAATRAQYEATPHVASQRLLMVPIREAYLRKRIEAGVEPEVAGS